MCASEKDHLRDPSAMGDGVDADNLRRWKNLSEDSVAGPD